MTLVLLILSASITPRIVYIIGQWSSPMVSGWGYTFSGSYSLTRWMRQINAVTVS